MFWYAAAVIATGALQAYGEIQSSQAKAEAAERDAFLKRKQADETMGRAQTNMDIIKEEGAFTMGAMASAYAGGGADVGSGSPLQAMENAAYRINRQAANVYTEARFRAEQLRAGADSSSQYGQDVLSAGRMSAATSLLTAGLYAGEKGGLFDEDPSTSSKSSKSSGKVTYGDRVYNGGADSGGRYPKAPGVDRAGNMVIGGPIRALEGYAERDWWKRWQYTS